MVCWDGVKVLMENYWGCVGRVLKYKGRIVWQVLRYRRGVVWQMLRKSEKTIGDVLDDCYTQLSARPLSYRAQLSQVF